MISKRYRVMVVFLAGSCCAVASATEFWITDGPDLWWVDSERGEIEWLGTLPVGGDAVLEIALAPDGRLYGVAGSILYLIDPLKVSAEVIGALETQSIVSGLAFAPDGTLYGLQWNNFLYQIDPETAETALLDQVGIPVSTHTLDIDAAGDAYAPGFDPFNSEFLYRIDLDTLEIDSTIPMPNLISAMVFDDEGNLFAVDGGQSNSLFIIDPMSGESQVVMSLAPLDDIEGIEIIPPQPPCPGDANGDGMVDTRDSGYVAARFGCSVGTGELDCDAADQNADGAVDPLDVGFVLARFGACS